MKDLRLLNERIKEHNAKFIRDQSGLRLAAVLSLTLRAARYHPLPGGTDQDLPVFLKVPIKTDEYF